MDRESENRLRERLESPEGERLLNELAMVLAHAAAEGMLKEAEKCIVSNAGRRCSGHRAADDER